MNKRLILLIAGLVAVTILSACKQEAPAPAPKQTAAQPAETVQPQAAAEQQAGRSGKVVETMDAMSYTYIKVDTGSESFWAATSQIPIKVGDDVLVPEGTAMANFHSKALERTFDMIYFVPSVMVAGATPDAGQAEMPEGHPAMNGNGAAAGNGAVDTSGIAPVEGGVTVADIFEKTDELAGKPVTLRGKVVKFSPQIMKKNWMHIQDGTGTAGGNDLVVTTAAEAAVGDTVLVSGVVSVDVDFGYGYQYAIIIQDAEITKE